jgi:hypothetical protein
MNFVLKFSFYRLFKKKDDTNMTIIKAASFSKFYDLSIFYTL